MNWGNGILRAVLVAGLGLLVASAAGVSPGRAAQATVAVSANFLTTAEQLSETFSDQTGHDITLVHGATGRLTTQIERGAPFDLFLSADTARPERLHGAGLTLDAPRSYALGRVALILQAGHGIEISDPGPHLKGARRIAMADPRLAPYGQAAQEVLERLAPEALAPAQDRLVFGENVAQALAFVATGNAPVGLVALAQARESGLPHAALDAGLHAPIRQDAVLLTTAEGNAAARAFYDYLFTDGAAHIIAVAGYEVPR